MSEINFSCCTFVCSGFETKVTVEGREKVSAEVSVKEWFMLVRQPLFHCLVRVCRACLADLSNQTCGEGEDKKCLVLQLSSSQRLSLEKLEKALTSLPS